VQESFWDRGDFPQIVQNGSEAVILNNPWVNGTQPAPFDQRVFSLLGLLTLMSVTDQLFAIDLFVLISVLSHTECCRGRDERLVP